MLSDSIHEKANTSDELGGESEEEEEERGGDDCIRELGGRGGSIRRWVCDPDQIVWGGLRWLFSIPPPLSRGVWRDWL